MTTNTNPINAPAANPLPRAGKIPSRPASYPPDLAANEAKAARACVSDVRAALRQREPQPITQEEIRDAIISNPGPALGIAAGAGLVAGFILKKMLPAKKVKYA